MPARDLPSTKSLALRQLFDKTLGDEQAPDDRIVEPMMSPIDFIPIPGSMTAKIGKRIAGEGAELAAPLMSKIGALNKMRGAVTEAAPAAERNIGEVINPDIYKMQTTGEVSPALRQRDNVLTNQIKDLNDVNDFDYNRMQELQQANNVVPINSAQKFGNTDVTSPIDQDRFEKTKKLMFGN